MTTLPDQMRELILKRDAGGGRDKLRIVGHQVALANFTRACREDLQPRANSLEFMGVPLLASGSPGLDPDKVYLVAIEGSVET